MFNFTVIEKTTKESTRFSIGCLEKAAELHALMVLLKTHDVTEVSEGPLPERSDVERERGYKLFKKALSV